MKNQLYYSITDSFQTKSDVGFSAVKEFNPGINIAISDIVHTSDTIKFILKLSYGFYDGFYFAFEDIRKAIAIQMDDPGSGFSATFPLLDPTINYLDQPITNFKSDDDPNDSSIAFFSGNIGIPLEVAIDKYGPGLYVRALLQSYCSNTIHIPVEKREDL